MAWLKIIADPEYRTEELATELPKRRPRQMPVGTSVTQGRFIGDDFYLNIVDPADQGLAEELLYGWGVPFVREEPPHTAGGIGGI